MRHKTRPYVIVLRGNTWRGTKDAPERMTTADARVLAGCCRIPPVSRNAPRSSCVVALGGQWLELRYIDPRPGAPSCIAPLSQEETAP